ncbi:unnamed protein product [Candida verbasci]|uniref:non-specific serine/threonine protein kinase n=1 Tax=Candida verbasci TaxID=1227364 RepID=A0A9W4U396_9ASCO|nr:unnamed protein product [Candida verbasci]
MMLQNEEFKSYENGKSLLNNRFKFIKHLQSGSFGKVSLAYDVVNSIQVSVKVIPKNFHSLQEIQYLERLKSNESICQIKDYFKIGTTNKDSYYVLILDYYSNGDLYDLVHTRKLSRDEIKKLSNQLICGLKYAHSLGIYHRDLKPENILIDYEGNFKIGDWGLATSIRFNNEFNIGSEKYMSPELKIINDKSCGTIIDCKYSDYWSIGVTILTAILGSCPFKEYYTIEQSFENLTNFKNKDIFTDLLKYGNDEEIKNRDLDLFLQRINDVEDGFDEIDDEKIDEINEKIDTKEKIDEKIDETKEKIEEIEETDEIESDDHLFFSMDEQESFNAGDYNTEKVDFDIDLPALVKNSYQSAKSWCDYDDDFDFELEISKLNLNKLNTNNDNDKKHNDKKHNDNEIRVMETEIFDIIDV